MARRLALICAAALGMAAFVPLAAAAQTIVFGGIRADTSAEVQVSADSLTVDQTDGSAVFSGDVVVTQGEMRLSAAQVRVEYGSDGQREIKRLLASGGVMLVSGLDAVQSDSAEYSILAGTIEMIGNVLLSQGGNVLSSERLTVNLVTGSATAAGRVQTTLRPGGN